jgi:hypothetical protein
MAVIPRRSLPVSWRIQVSVLERGEVEALQTDATSSVNSPEASMWTKSFGNWLKSGSEPGR